MQGWICKNKYSNKIQLFFDKPEKHWKKVLREDPNTPNAEEHYPFWSSCNHMDDERKIPLCYALPERSFNKKIRKIQDLNPQWEDEEPIEIEVNFNIIDDGRK